MGTGGSTLRILGSLELIGPSGPVRLGAAKERCLLAVLALHLGEPVSQDQLAEALWGEQPSRSAANALQNYVLRLRRALQAAEGVQIVTDPAGYRLQAPSDVVDARLAERLIAEGREVAGGDPATAARLLREALALWRGRPLAEFADRPFAQAEAARLEELHESAREDLADAELALGRHHDVLSELEVMVVSHPLRERRWGQLLLARYRDGRQAEALEGFHALRRTLRDELGVDPSPELQDLHDRILHHDPALAWRPPEHTRVPSGAPCYGRDDELRRMLGVYDTTTVGGGRVVTVLGEAGIGKTRLLQEFARRSSSPRRREPTCRSSPPATTRTWPSWPSTSWKAATTASPTSPSAWTSSSTASNASWLQPDPGRGVWSTAKQRRRLLTSWCGSGGRPCRRRNGVRPAVRAARGRCREGTGCRLPPRWARGTGGTRRPTRP
jgi:DNA-binding SARP family transcriptional activator